VPTLKEEIAELCFRARRAAHELGLLTPAERTAVLAAIAAELKESRSQILAENEADVAEAEKRGLSKALLDRLRLSATRFDDMLRSVAEVANLRDPVGSILEEKIRPNALLIQKVRVPIGLIAIIFESRPNVTVDSATLCLRSGNAVVLRGGTDARRSNRALVEAICRGLRKQGLAGETVTLVQSEEREAIKHLVQMEGVVDLVIPRGGEGLIRAVTEVARVPVIKHYKGVCHVFVDESASVEMAIRIVENAKCQRPGVCNALETLLVHERIAEKALPAIAQVLLGSGVELRGDDKSRNIVPEMQPAEESDWSEEYLDLILSVRIVPSLEEAIRHINRYGSHHSDAIVSEDRLAQERFLREIDSAAVYVNASTRFTDGGEFGLGAEIGISTDKLHARGPMGVEELTTYKYLINGSGQTR